MNPFLGPPLHQFNLASHLVWAVAAFGCVVVVVMGVIEAYDGVRERWRSRHEEDANEP